MNVDELADLVARARAAEGPASVPPEHLVDRARASARQRRTFIIAAGVVAILGIVGIVTAGLTQQRDAAPVIGPTPETRLVGAHGLVLEIPEDWQTDVEFGTYCPPSTSKTVEFFVRYPQGPLGSCAIDPDATWPAKDSLSVYTDFPVDAPNRPPDGSVAGMDYYLADAEQRQGSGVARSLSVPEARIQFVVGAASGTEADAVLTTVQPVPDGMTTVAVALAEDTYTPVLLDDPAHHLGSEVVEVPANDDGERPGQLVRTDPAVGTPVADGATVTIVRSAGDLDAYVSTESLARAGWNVSPATTFETAITRAQAYVAVPDKLPLGGAPGNDGIFLRTIGDRLVWIVVLDQGQRDRLRLSAIDANTGEVLRDHVFPQS